MKFYTTILIMLLCILTLQGCTNILLIGTTTLLTTAWNDPRTIGTQLDDKILKTHIYRALQKNKKIKKFTRIKNIVYQGNVLLIGQSPSKTLIKDTINIIHDIYGIKKIYNAIRINPPITLDSILLDYWIHLQIRFYLLVQKNMFIPKIKIVTENQEVFLIGPNIYQDIISIKKIANNTQKVTNVITIPICIKYNF